MGVPSPGANGVDPPTLLREVIGSGTGRPHGTEGVELSRIETASMFASMISELDDEGEGDASGEPQPAS